MTESYFEITDQGNLIKVNVLNRSYPIAEDEDDQQWLDTIINVKAGAFSGQFSAQLRLSDFSAFKSQLEKLYDKLNGYAEFYTLEEQIEIKITGDGIGHLNASILLQDQPGIGSTLEFEINFDQTQIPLIVRQLHDVLNRFISNQS